jgi:hypothetical protein
MVRWFLKVCFISSSFAMLEISTKSFEDVHDAKVHK